MANTLIPAVSGTPIGSMTGGGNLAASFDGTVTKVAAACSTSTVGGGDGYIGKNWGATTFVITEFIIYSPSDDGFNGGGSSQSLTLFGKNSAPANSTDGTSLFVGTYPGGTAQTLDQSTGITLTNAYSYHWLTLGAPGGGFLSRMAQVQFYTSLILAPRRVINYITKRI